MLDSQFDLVLSLLQIETLLIQAPSPVLETTWSHAVFQVFEWSPTCQCTNHRASRITLPSTAVHKVTICRRCPDTGGFVVDRNERKRANNNIVRQLCDILPYWQCSDKSTSVCYSSYSSQRVTADSTLCWTGLMTATITSTFATRRLDYCNAILSILPRFTIVALQRALLYFNIFFIF